MRIYKVEEWQNGSKWYAGDQSDLAHGSNMWYIPARMLRITFEEWILKLINEFHASVKFSPTANNGKGFLSVCWDNYADCHKYALWINKKARENFWTFP